MDRLSYTAEQVEPRRAEIAAIMPSYSDPCPGSALKVDDDVMWLGFLPMRVIWGYDHPEFFAAYAPEWFGETWINADGKEITDRAPADSEETPMPIWPQQARQMQDQRPHKKDRKKALQHVLKQLSPEQAQIVREKLRALRPELLEP